MINSTQQAIEEFGKVTAEAKSLFGNLSSHQLNWKPAPEKWSIAQCLDHLMISNRSYFPQFDEISSGKHQNSFYQNIRFLSNYFGKYLVDNAGPVVNKPMKNPPVFTPSQSHLPGTVISDFEKHQQELCLRMERLNKTDLDKTVIYSPVTKIITYNLHATFTLLVGHEQRHFAQARNVLNHPNFPK